MDTAQITAFCVLPQEQLSEEAFDRFPVWSEHYDFEEIDDIVGWGLDREYVLSLLDEHSPGDEHCVYTLLESNPFPPRMRIFIRATIRAADGRVLKGFVMNEDAFCLEIFHGGERFIFSRHSMLGSENQKQEQDLLTALGSGARVFPVWYDTEFNNADGAVIAGVFMFGTEES